MMIFAMFIVQSIGGLEVMLKPRLTLGPLPETEILMGASHVVVDEGGNFYALDVGASKIFVWDGHGHFLRSFGGRGQGPGEFGFKPFSGLVGYVDVFDDRILVYDAAMKRLTFFDKEGGVLKIKSVQAPPGSIYNLYVPREGQFILDIQNRTTLTPTRNVSLYNFEGERIRELLSIPDQTYESVKIGEHVTGAIFKIFEPSLSTAFDAVNDRLICGIGDQTRLLVMDLSRGKESTISFEMKRQWVTDEDIDEHGQIRWIQESPYFSAVYAEQKPFFNRIMALEDNFLVANISPFYRNLNGVLLDAGGKTLGRIHFAMGEAGNLHCSRGRLIYSGLNQNDEVVIKWLEVSLVKTATAGM